MAKLGPGGEFVDRFARLLRAHGDDVDVVETRHDAVVRLARSSLLDDLGLPTRGVRRVERALGGHGCDGAAPARPHPSPRRGRRKLELASARPHAESDDGNPALHPGRRVLLTARSWQPACGRARRQWAERRRDAGGSRTGPTSARRRSSCRRRRPDADYKVRIFTPAEELSFAGHPTLGTCHAWLEAGGVARGGDVIVQECGAGLVPVKRDGERLAFAAPPRIKDGSRRPEHGREGRIVARHRARWTSSTRSGSTTDRAGSRSCSRASTRC